MLILFISLSLSLFDTLYKSVTHSYEIQNWHQENSTLNNLIVACVLDFCLLVSICRWLWDSVGLLWFRIWNATQGIRVLGSVMYLHGVVYFSSCLSLSQTIFSHWIYKSSGCHGGVSVSTFAAHAITASRNAVPAGIHVWHAIYKPCTPLHDLWDSRCSSLVTDEKCQKLKKRDLFTFLVYTRTNCVDRGTCSLWRIRMHI